MGAAARTRSPSARHAAATPTAPRGPQRAEAPAAFRIPASKVKLRHLRAAAIGRLHPDKTVPRADRDRDRPVRSARPAAGHYCRTARSPAGWRHPRTGARDRASRRRTRGRPAPAPPARPATVTLSRISGPAISAPAFPGRLSPADHRGRQAGCTGMHARLSGSRQAGTRDRRGPSVAVRGKRTVHTDRPRGRAPSAMCPWTPRHSGRQRSTAVQGDT